MNDESVSMDFYGNKREMSSFDTIIDPKSIPRHGRNSSERVLMEENKPNEIQAIPTEYFELGMNNKKEIAWL